MVVYFIWGVDVGVVVLIYCVLIVLCDVGMVILVVFEDFDELFLFSDCIVVLCLGWLCLVVVIVSVLL